MAEDFSATGICGGAWWNSPKSVMSPAEICLSPCSMGFVDSLITPNGFDLSPHMKPGLSCTENNSTCGNNSIVFGNKLQREADSDSGGSTVTIDSTLQMMGLGFSSSSSSDWNQNILQEDFNSNLMGNTSQDHCHGFLSVTSPFASSSSSSSLSSSSSNLLQSFYESESNPSLLNNTRPMNNLLTSFYSEDPQISWPKTEPFLKPMSSSMITSSKQHTNYGFNLSNPNLNNIRANSFLTSPQISTRFEEKPFCHNNITSKTVKKTSNESTTKKPRITTPSPLPTFKVRKENLRDQITALQQLVSPFGKTDTASVLQEAIEYIKFLHDQVSVLCTPYLKQGNSAQQQQQQFSDKPKTHQENDIQDLKGRGLCLVPISSTFPVANETTADFWTPTFGGNNFR